MKTMFTDKSRTNETSKRMTFKEFISPITRPKEVIGAIIEAAKEYPQTRRYVRFINKNKDKQGEVFRMSDAISDFYKHRAMQKSELDCDELACLAVRYGLTTQEIYMISQVRESMELGNRGSKHPERKIIDTLLSNSSFVGASPIAIEDEQNRLLGQKPDISSFSTPLGAINYALAYQLEALRTVKMFNHAAGLDLIEKIQALAVRRN